MKKIMFNDKYGLTEAVLDGRKTQTRRIIKLANIYKVYLDDAFVFGFDQRKSLIIDMYAKYKVGEVVAVAQSYSIVADYMLRHNLPFFFDSECAGWNNKMFVKAELMPSHIRITNIRVEKLQDISDEDCLEEGVLQIPIVGYYTNDIYYTNDMNKVAKSSKFTVYETPREAYAALIDKVSGKGTWESNPYVLAYDFERID